MMSFHYVPYIWPLFVSAFFTFTLGLYVMLRRRNSKGFTSFTIAMLIVTLWSLGNALEMSGTDFETKLFWANVQYFAYCYSPVALLALCMEFTGYDEWLRNKKIVWFAVIPTIVIILVWTDRFHNLIRHNMHMDYSGIFPVIAKNYGPVFFIHAAYSHFLNIFAWVLLIRATFFRKTIYRKQTIALLIGVSFIVLPNIFYIVGLGPMKQFDITPVFFCPAGIIITWGIFRFKMFDLVPLARDTVIETMDAGVMVLDLQNRVLDINPVLEKMIGMPMRQIATKNVLEVCREIPELARACLDKSITHTEFSIHTKELCMIYEVLLSPLTNNQGIRIGRLVVIYEITEKKQAQQIFLKQQWKLAVNEERERLARDLHDNLGQVLGFINLQAQGIRQEIINSGIETVAYKIDKLVEVTQAAHEEIREYIRNVRTTCHLENDYIATLKKALVSFEEQTGVNVKLVINSDLDDERLSPSLRLHIVNILKEALNNVRKHAEAKNVEIIFELSKEELHLSIEDDGKGFDNVYNNSKIKNTFGLDIMRERATEIGGTFDIKTVIGKGTCIKLKVPIKEGEEKHAKEINAG